MARIYRPAVEADLPAIQALLVSARMKMDGVPTLGFVAEEDSRIIAALGADWSNGQHVIAGPLLVAPGCKGKRYAVLRLVEMLEAFLARAKVRSYLFGVAVNNQRWNRIVQRSGARHYATSRGRNWYIREVGGYGQPED